MLLIFTKNKDIRLQKNNNLIIEINKKINTFTHWIDVSE